MKHTWRSVKDNCTPKLRRDGLADEQKSLAPGGPTGRRIMVTGKQVHCPNEPPLRHKQRIPRAAAISYLTDGPHDVRPQLLLMWFGEGYADPSACVRYGRAYMRAWCARVDRPKIVRAAEAAAADALVLLYLDLSKDRIQRDKVKRYSIAERCEQFRMSTLSFLILRTKIESVYRERLAEALVLFHRALHRDVLHEKAHCPRGVRWNYGQTGSAATAPEAFALHAA